MSLLPPLPSLTPATFNSPSDAIAHSAPRAHQRVPRACDSCRKMKIRCIMPHAPPCHGCAAQHRPCLFEDSGIKREKLPPKSQVSQLQSQVHLLESVLKALVPTFDFTTLPSSDEHLKQLTFTAAEPPYQPATTRGVLTYSSPLDLESYRDKNSNLSKFCHQISRSMARLHITPTEYFDSLDSHSSPAVHGARPGRWEQPDGSGEPNLSYYINNQNRSTVERLVESYHLFHASHDRFYPAPDLADSLIALFFEKVHPYEVILHEGEFRRLYKSGLANTDNSFRGLCHAVFAAASRFSNDFRVFPTPSDNNTVDKQAAGALYAACAGSLLSPCTLPLTLFDLQMMAVLSYYLIGATTPMTAWFSVGMFLRRAQDVGAHESVPRWETSIMKDQLRKRAFWYLVYREMQLCVSLGRVSCMKYTSPSIADALMIDDEHLSQFCDAHPAAPPSSVNDLLQKSPLIWPTTADQIARRAGFDLLRQFGIQLQLLWSIKVVPQTEAWAWDRASVKKMAQAIDHHIEHASPSEARWNPEASNQVDLISTARFELYVASKLATYARPEFWSRLFLVWVMAVVNSYSSFWQIVIHRHLITTDPQELKVCLGASSKTLDVLEHLKNRGLLDITATVTPYLVTPAALTFIYAACTSHQILSASGRADAWADAHRCINILAALAPTTFQAEKLQCSLAYIVKNCIDEQLFPGSTTLATGLKRSFSPPTCINPAMTIGEPYQHKGPSSESSLMSSDLNTPSPEPPLELFNLTAPQLAASLFEFPGKASDTPPAWEAPEWFPLIQSENDSCSSASLFPGWFDDPSYTTTATQLTIS